MTRAHKARQHDDRTLTNNREAGCVHLLTLLLNQNIAPYREEGGVTLGDKSAISAICTPEEHAKRFWGTN